MIRIGDPSKCCGCSSCVAICPHDAITMYPDKLGFPYPKVDPVKCVECGLCDSVCAFVPDVEAVRTDVNVGRVSAEVDCRDLKVEGIAARNKDSEVLAQSQSGGVFSALAEKVLNDGGVVYGAAFDESHRVHHIRVDSSEGLAALRGSKYVQSDLTGIFRKVKADLKASVKVLFVGTPCQVAGLKSYIPASLQKTLTLVDFICHGVPSPAIWKDYLKHMSRRGEIVKANFRDKQVGGWKKHTETFRYSDGEKKVADSFRVLFYKNIMLRHSCGVCPYDIVSHKSDVTIADFWGVEEVLPQMDGDEGTSRVVCNTEKGRKLLEQASAALLTAEAVLDYDFMSRRNPNLVRAARIDKDRLAFEEEYARKGFLSVARHWGDLGIRYKVWLIKKYITSFVTKNKQ